MHLNALLALASAVAVTGSPVARNLAGRQSSPSVQINSGNIVGSTSGGVDSFKGIPFAQPPVGNLRLKPPQPIQGSLGTVNAVGTPRSCPQQAFINLPNVANEVLSQIEALPLFQKIENQGEDCLTLNVQRPAGIGSNASLPVVVWIYGGGFEFGSTQTYDGASIIKTSLSLNKPILYVAMNYRVSAFGFLQGKELQADGSTNLGLKDQRLALKWVQDNIKAFGGDPTKVTIWGESAGAISVFDHTIINGGDNSYKGGKLFRGAIMDSGSIVPTEPVDGQTAQNVYDTFVAAAGCSGAADTLACIRAAPYGTFLAAQNSLPSIFSYRSLDLSYLPRPDPSDNFFSLSPEVSVKNGAFTKVPIIIGDQEDEGTLFSLVQYNVTTTDRLIDYLASYFPTVPNVRQSVSDLVALYPNDISAGSPFRTGIFNEIRPQYKRLAAILGDLVFTLTRRAYLSVVSDSVPSWTYLSTYLYGTPVIGTAHASDLNFAYGELGSNNVPTKSIQRYYVSFVNALDPNALGTSAPLIQWPQWSNSGRDMLDFGLLDNSIIKDDFREAAYEYLLANSSTFRA